MAKKVNQETKEKKEKGRVNFPKAEAKMKNEAGKLVKATNADGLLTTVPRPIVDGDKVLYGGYNISKHKPLKKTEFADIATYLEFLGYSARQKAAKLIASAEDKEAKAERIRKYGDEGTRKKAEKLLKLRDKLAALEAQLKEEGVDIDAVEAKK